MRWRPRYSLRTLAVFLLLVTSGFGLWWHWEAWYQALLVDGSQYGVALSPSGTRMLIFGDESMFDSLSLWDAATGRRVFKVRTGLTFSIAWASFSPDGTKVLVPGFDPVDPLGEGEYVARIIDASGGSCLATLRTRKSFITAGTFSPDGRRVLTEVSSMPAIVWDASNGRRLFSLGADDAVVPRAIYSPDGDYIATDLPLAIWDAKTGRCLRTLRADVRSAGSISFSCDGRRLLSVHEKGAYFVWDVASGRRVAGLGRDPDVWGYAFLPCPGRLLARRGDLGVCVARESDGSVLVDLVGCRPAEKCACPSPDGRRIAAAFDEFEGLGLWSLETGECLAELLPRDELVTGASFSADGRSLAVGSDYRALVYRRRRPEWWWGVFCLKEFWLTVAFAGLFVWSVWRDRRALTS